MVSSALAQGRVRLERAVGAELHDHEITFAAARRSWRRPRRHKALSADKMGLRLMKSLER